MDPSEYKNLIKPMSNESISYTKGNRFLDSSYFSKSPKIRFYGNFILTIVSKFSIGNFKMGDPLNGYTCIKNTFKNLNFSNIRNDFFFETSMLYELKRIKAATEDVKVNIKYSGEISNFKLHKEFLRFIYLHFIYFIKRIFMKLFRDIFLFSIILFLSLGLYCASKNGWLPLVHGPYYFSIGQSLFNYNEINQYAIYPPVQSLVYTLQIGISFFEYLIFFITEKFWYIPFYGIISIIWVIAFNEFLKLNLKYIDRIDKYLIFSIFFLQPYNLNQLGNFSNESLYFPLLLYFYFSFFRNSLSKINVNFYWIALSIFIIFGVYFRLHHVVICINFLFLAYF